MLKKFGKKTGLSKAFSSLEKMKIPAIIVSAILIIFEHLFAGLRAGYVTNIGFTVYVTAVMYLVVAIAVGFYFTFTGIRIIRFLNNTLSAHSTKTETIRKVR